MRPWIIYTRVSTDEQAREGVSLAAQRDALNGLLLAKGAAAIEMVEDPGYSGGSLRRPGIQSLLPRVDAGELAGIAVWKLDRLTRSLRDLLDLVDRLQTGDCQLLSLQESIDTAGPMGRFQLSLLGALAELEREQIGERVRLARAHLQREGRWTGGSIPPGCRVVIRDGARYLERDPQRGALVAACWQQILDGASLTQVGHYLQRHAIPTARGAQRWPATSVRGLLTRQDVIGHLVDQQTWQDAQDALSARRGRLAGSGSGPVTERPWPLRGIARCGRCGATLTGVIAGRGSRAYLRCGTRIRHGRQGCAQRDLPAEAYEQAVVEALQQELTGDAPAIDLLAADLAAQLQSQVDDPQADAQIADRTRDRDLLQRRLDRWLELAADGTDAEAAQLRPRIRQASAQIAAQEAQIATLSANRHTARFTLRQIEQQVTALKYGAAHLARATPTELTTILPAILAEAAIHEGDRIDLTLSLDPNNKGPDLAAGPPCSKERTVWLAGPYFIRTSVGIRELRGARGARLVQVSRGRSSENAPLAPPRLQHAARSPAPAPERGPR